MQVDATGRIDPQRSRKLAHAFGYVEIVDGPSGRVVRLRCISSETGENLWDHLDLPL